MRKSDHDGRFYQRLRKVRKYLPLRHRLNGEQLEILKRHRQRVEEMENVTAAAIYRAGKSNK